MAISEAQKDAKRKYRKKTISFSMELYPKTDADIIEILIDRTANGEPKASYIKRLIREDILKIQKKSFQQP